MVGGRQDAVLSTSKRHLLSGDLRVSRLQAMPAEQATDGSDPANVCFDLNLAHF